MILTKNLEAHSLVHAHFVMQISTNVGVFRVRIMERVLRLTWTCLHASVKTDTPESAVNQV